MGNRPLKTWEPMEYITWVKLFIGREGDVLGRMAEDKIAGKTAFISNIGFCDRAVGGEFLKVYVKAEFRKAVKVTALDFLSEGDGSMFSVHKLANARSFPGPLSNAKAMFSQHFVKLRRKDREEQQRGERERRELEAAEKERQDEVLEKYDTIGFELYLSLKAHDWFWSYSDSRGVRERGRNEWTNIRSIIRGMKNKAHAREIWNLASPPEGFEFPEPTEEGGN